MKTIICPDHQHIGLIHDFSEDFRPKCGKYAMTCGATGYFQPKDKSITEELNKMAKFTRNKFSEKYRNNLFKDIDNEQLFCHPCALKHQVPARFNHVKTNLHGVCASQEMGMCTCCWATFHLKDLYQKN